MREIRKYGNPSREIRFRGREFDLKEWHYGYFRQDRSGHCYIEDADGHSVLVNPYTVSQFVCKDINGNEAYEGDYICLEDPFESALVQVAWDDEHHGFELIGISVEDTADAAAIEQCGAVRGSIYDHEVLPGSIYVVDDVDLHILGDMDVYEYEEDFVKAVYEDECAMECLEECNGHITPKDVDTQYYLCGWVFESWKPGAVGCWYVTIRKDAD